MKIAVATADGVSVSQHFGQSAGFIVFEVEGKSVTHRESRTNEQTPHAQGICQHGHDHQPQGQHEQSAHNHTGILAMIGDCEIVLCGGMGGGAAQALRQAGIRPVILPTAGLADDVVSQYLNGTVSEVESGFCQCKH